MKSKMFIWILSVMLFFGGTFTTYAQDTVKLTKKELRKFERRKKKEEKERSSFKQRLKYAKMLKDQRFVFQANILFGPQGESYSVSPSINFLAVKGNQVVLQFGFEGVIGWNGVGGLTSEGYLENYKFEPGKKKNSALSINSRVRPISTTGSPYFHLTVLDDGSAQLDVNMALGGHLRMSGYIVSLKKADIFKGQTLF